MPHNTLHKNHATRALLYSNLSIKEAINRNCQAAVESKPWLSSAILLPQDLITVYLQLWPHPFNMQCSLQILTCSYNSRVATVSFVELQERLLLRVQLLF